MTGTSRSFGAFLVLAASMAAQAQQAAYTWTDITPQAPFPYVYQVAVHPHVPGRLVVTGHFGPVEQGRYAATVMVTYDAGSTWWLSTSRPTTSVYGRLYSHIGRPDVVFLSMAFFGYRTPGEVSFLRSDDFGLTWSPGYATRTDSEQAVSPFASDPFDPSHLFGSRRGFATCSMLGCTTPGDTTVIESRDGGVTWSAPLGGMPQPYGYAFYHGVADPPTPVAPLRMFFATPDTVFVSHSGGAIWTRFDTGAAGPLHWVRQDPRRPNVLYALQREPSPNIGRTKLLRSDDGGATWHAIFNVENTFPWYEKSPMVTVNPVHSREVWLTGLEAGVFHSTDAGETWGHMGFAAGAYRPGTSGVDFDGIVDGITVSASDPGVVYLVLRGHLYRGTPAALPDPVVVEFQYEGNRYWSTSLDGEALSQDYRMEPGNFRRTGLRFGAWRADDAPAGALGSCRFWPQPQSGLRTRVLVLQGSECDGLKNNANWILEAENEFFAMPPSDGDCAGGLVPVRRFSNLQADLNFRWIADVGIAVEMRARGWYDEGVRMCARPLGSNE